MQIREISLKELDLAFNVLSQLHTELSYKEFEDLIYEMQQMHYKMLGIFEDEKVVCYAGVCILTTFVEKRHLRVFDFVSLDKNEKYKKLMEEFLDDYAKTAACEKIVFEKKR